MLINPYEQPERVAALAGTRLLQDDLGLTGVRTCDPKEPLREWMVQSVYAPVPGRALGGIRVKMVDTKGFVTFSNQRDLEVLLGIARPGSWCRWAGHEYVGPDHREWFGLCADEDDLLDDLQERELYMRGEVPGGILMPPIEFTRRVHLDARNDWEEIFFLKGDYDPNTGMYPDPRFETIEFRWIRSQREKINWYRL